MVIRVNDTEHLNRIGTISLKMIISLIIPMIIDIALKYNYIKLTETDGLSLLLGSLFFSILSIFMVPITIIFGIILGGKLALLIKVKRDQNGAISLALFAFALLLLFFIIT